MFHHCNDPIRFGHFEHLELPRCCIVTWHFLAANSKLQSVSWGLAEFRHNKIVQLLCENCFNVCRQLQRKVRSRKHDV